MDLIGLLHGGMCLVVATVFLCGALAPFILDSRTADKARRKGALK